MKSSYKTRENGYASIIWLKVNPNWYQGSKQPVRRGFMKITPQQMDELLNDHILDDDGNYTLEVALWIDTRRDDVISGTVKVQQQMEDRKSPEPEPAQQRTQKRTKNKRGNNDDLPF